MPTFNEALNTVIEKHPKLEAEDFSFRPDNPHDQEICLFFADWIATLIEAVPKKYEIGVKILGVTQIMFEYGILIGREMERRCSHRSIK